MKTIDEKEKKFEEVLKELKNLEIANPNQLEELEIIKNQKNQLEIEKLELQKKYDSLEEINENLKRKLKKNKISFNSKILRSDDKKVKLVFCKTPENIYLELVQINK